MISKVAARWRKQYFDGVRWSDTMSGSSEATYKALRALPANVSAERVAEIIGNETWVGHLCSECWEYQEHAMEFGENTIICRDCIKDALAMFGEAKEARS